MVNVNGVPKVPEEVVSSSLYEADKLWNGPGPLILFETQLVDPVKLKFPEVTGLDPAIANPLNVTPFTVVDATPTGPRLKAPTSVPLVLTSASPEMFVAEPHVMTAEWPIDETTPNARDIPSMRIEEVFISSQEGCITNASKWDQSTCRSKQFFPCNELAQLEV